jgi:amino acid permease
VEDKEWEKLNKTFMILALKLLTFIAYQLVNKSSVWERYNELDLEVDNFINKNIEE